MKAASFFVILAAVLFYYQSVNCAPFHLKDSNNNNSYGSRKQSTPAAAPAVSGKYRPDEESAAVSQVTASILTKLHYQKKRIDTATSIEFFHAYLEKLDPLHMFFTQEQISQWEYMAPTLIKDIMNGKTQFAFIVYNHYLDQLKKYKQFVTDFQVNPDQLKGNETFELDRTKVEWPKNEAELKTIWRKKLLNDVILLKILEKIEAEKAAAAPAGQPKTGWKKAPPLAQVKKRAQQFIANEESATSTTIVEHYLNALASLYDPHTQYMAPATEEDFNINMSLSLCGIGAVLSPADDGSIRIVKIIPGGPAMKNGQLQAEDRIIAVAQGNQEPVDVIDMPLHKVVSLIRGPAGTEVVITALDAKEGATGHPKTVRLVREEIELKESEAKSEVRVIKDASGIERRIAIITLPSFYCDFEAIAAGKRDYKSSTRDVQNLLREIRKGGKIDALIMDLRFNGGGSLAEAIKLTGLFIPKGPVVQVLDSNGDVDVENDDDGGKVEYAGPLLVVTNRFSASASEIFAGAIQDYGRGIIAGDDKTHGKGTVQTIVDINQYFKYLGIKFKGGALKLTKAKFYRINGHSTQLRGVIPDIIVPSYTSVMDAGEDSLDHPLPWDEIRPAYTGRVPSLNHIIKVLREKSQQRIAASQEFKNLNRDMERYRKNREKKYVSLNFEIRWKEYQEQKRILEEQERQLNEEGSDSAKKKDILLDEMVRIATDYAQQQ
ncbi:MAG: carboxy terminal-processing peptidase [Lentisphaeria bacterium]|nr:carboxy terminal-processing peptidase [Lentisphaeria bacterium]